jgi:hypothetical protein
MLCHITKLLPAVFFGEKNNRESDVFRLGRFWACLNISLKCGWSEVLLLCLIIAGETILRYQLAEGHHIPTTGNPDMPQTSFLINTNQWHPKCQINTPLNVDQTNRI